MKAIDTSKNIDHDKLRAILVAQEFDVQLEPEILYQRIEG